MNAVLALLLVVAAAMLVMSTRRLIAANRGSWLSYIRNPPVVPAGAIGLRALGGGISMFCAIVADLPNTWWATFVVLLAWLPALALQVWHNARNRPSPA
ncbi:hypothetical protein G6016_14895 [Dietzia aerolata]|uniref:DUF3325 domain-containing protein n=1 Tax=Dietzia aerolata TaxID=595984 RepID=A0ABV5JKT6_9ACTN|nr:hypothetical protein [Dietzia aerolata]MBB0970219.1 hypothetical protein [Dietzia aerolata]